MSYNPSRSVSTVCNIEIYHFKEFMENNEMILTGSRGNFRKRCLEKNSGFLHGFDTLSKDKGIYPLGT